MDIYCVLLLAGAVRGIFLSLRTAGFESFYFFGFFIKSHRISNFHIEDSLDRVQFRGHSFNRAFETIDPVSRVKTEGKI